MHISTTTESDNRFSRWARGNWFLIIGAGMVAIDIWLLIPGVGRDAAPEGYAFLATHLGLILSALALRRAQPTLAGALMGLAVVPYLLMVWASVWTWNSQ